MSPARRNPGDVTTGHLVGQNGRSRRGIVSERTF